MKRAYLIIISALLFLSFASPQLDFNQKKLQKLIMKTYELENYELLKANVPNCNFRHGELFFVKSNDNQKRLIYIGRVNSCRSGGCSLEIASDSETDLEEFEYFDYVIFFDSTITIQKVVIFNYQATHGYEVTAKSWLKQFNRYNGMSELVVGKNVDAISGATISVYAITDDISYVLSQLRENVSIILSSTLNKN